MLSTIIESSIFSFKKEFHNRKIKILGPSVCCQKQFFTFLLRNHFMFRKIFEKFISLDYSEIIIKGFATFVLISLFGWLRFYVVNAFKDDPFLHYTLDALVLFMLIYAVWKCFFYYKQYKGNRLAGLYHWNDHSNPEKVKLTEERIANTIKVADEVDMLLSSGLHTFKKTSCKGLSLKDAISVTHARVRVLLMDPHDEVICEKKLQRMSPDSEIAIDGFRKGIEDTIIFIERLQGDGRDIHYRLYNEIPVFRIVRIDHVLQVQPYVKWQRSRDTACLAFSSLAEYNKKTKSFPKNKTSLYIPFFNYFEELFERSRANKRSELRFNSTKDVEILYNDKETTIKTVDESENGLRISCNNNSCFVDKEFNKGKKDITVRENSHNLSGIIKWSRKIDNHYHYGIKIAK